MLGGVSLIAELADDSIGVPPASRGPVYAPVTMLRVVWHPAQFATALTRYPPRSTVGACAGLSTGGVAAGPIGLIMNAITALPSRLSCWSGTGLCTGGCARRNENNGPETGVPHLGDLHERNRAAAVRPDAVAQHARDGGVGQHADAGFLVGRDVRDFDRAQRNRECAAAGQWRPRVARLEGRGLGGRGGA